MANVFQQAREDIAGKLSAAGVTNVTLDPRGQLPNVLVGLPSVVGTEGIGGWAVSIPIEIATPPPGDLDAANWMLDALEPILVTLFGAPAEPRSLTRNGEDVPGYVVTLLVSVSNPNC